jgi:hypothetical protein
MATHALGPKSHGTKSHRETPADAQDPDRDHAGLRARQAAARRRRTAPGQRGLLEREYAGFTEATTPSHGFALPARAAIVRVPHPARLR